MATDLAIVIGHRESAQGAVAVDGTTEWQMHQWTARALEDAVESFGWRVKTVLRDDTPQGLDALAQKVDTYGALAAVSLHFNSFGKPSALGGDAGDWDGYGIPNECDDDADGDGDLDRHEAHGCEMLCARGSRRGHELASGLQAASLSSLRGVRSRGVKQIGRGGRGWKFLRCRPVAVLMEPFFGSNPRDLAVWYRDREAWVREVAIVLSNFLSGLE